jgi:D-alanyl-D-alanine carboxypeptidase/D-alanyl-D-alanine-endopeptidase (penicillin-binding protein 4)
VVTLLNHLKKEPGISSLFLPALPVAGKDGTLGGRMRGTSAQGRVRAKTGYLRPVVTQIQHLDGAVGLAGFATALNGRNYTFVFIYNGKASPQIVRNTFDKVCAEITGPLPKKISKSKKKKTVAS